MQVPHIHAKRQAVNAQSVENEKRKKSLQRRVAAILALGRARLVRYLGPWRIYTPSSESGRWARVRRAFLVFLQETSHVPLAHDSIPSRSNLNLDFKDKWLNWWLRRGSRRATVRMPSKASIPKRVAKKTVLKVALCHPCKD